MITDADVNLLHSCYCKMTGQNLRMNSLFDTRRLSWQRFLAAGHTVSELEEVILYLKKGIREDKRFPGCLRFGNLIENIPGFEEELELARAEKIRTRPAPTAREQVLEQWSPTMGAKAPPDSFVHISKVLEAMREAAR